MNQEEAPPMDGRFQPSNRFCNPKEDSVQPVVAEFLRDLYHCLAEPLPEAVHESENVKLCSTTPR